MTEYLDADLLVISDRIRDVIEPDPTDPEASLTQDSVLAAFHMVGVDPLTTIREAPRYTSALRWIRALRRAVDQQR